MSDVPKLRYGLDPKVFGLKVVSMHMEGIGVQRIAKQLSDDTKENVTHRQVTNLLKSPECQRIMNEINEAQMSTAKSIARQRGAGLINKAMDVIEHHLKKNNLFAVPHVLKLVGVDTDEKVQAQQALTIIMPGAKEDKVVEIQSESKDVKDVE